MITVFSQQSRRAHLVLVNGITLLFVLQCRAELGLALVNPRDQMMAEINDNVHRGLSHHISQYYTTTTCIRMSLFPPECHFKGPRPVVLCVDCQGVLQESQR